MLDKLWINYFPNYLTKIKILIILRVTIFVKSTLSQFYKNPHLHGVHGFNIWIKWIFHASISISIWSDMRKRMATCGFVRSNLAELQKNQYIWILAKLINYRKFSFAPKFLLMYSAPFEHFKFKFSINSSVLNF